MFKFRQGKKLIFSLICIMFVAITIFSAVKINNVNTNKHKSQIANAAAGYDFANGRFDNDNNRGYENTYFYISDYYELLEFSISVAYGYSFEGKTVYLENDIDANAPGSRQYANWQPIGASMNGTKYNVLSASQDAFMGIFDGSNHVVKNLKCKITEYDWRIITNDAYIGFFKTLKFPAQVKNLKIKNFSIDAKQPTLTFACVGGLAGCLMVECGDSTYEERKNFSVQNCIIEDFSANAYDYNKVGGFFCDLVSSTYFDEAFSDEKHPMELKMIDCVLNNFKIQDPNVDANKYYATILVTEPSYYNTFKWQVWFENLVLKDICKNGEQEIGDFFTDSRESYGLNDSNTSFNSKIIYKDKDDARSSLKTDGNWYTPPSDVFNNGWPYLMDFVGEFDDYEFEAGQNGSVQTSTGSNIIKVPQKNTDGTVINPLINFSGANEKTLFYGVHLTATPNAGYNFEYWNKKGNTYTAYFVAEMYKYKFASINGVEPKTYVSIEPGVDQGNNQLEAYYGYLYTFEQSFKNGNTILTYNYNNGNWKIIYTLPGKYTIDNNGLSVLVDSSNKVKNLEEDQVYTIAPTVKLKEYKVEYQ